MTNVYDTALDHPLVAATAWLPARPAERVNDHIWMSRSNSYSYVVLSDDGDVVINTGTPYQGARHRERFEQAIGRPLDVRAIVLTQSHPDHFGGWPAFDAPGVETIVQERFHKTAEARAAVAPYLRLRPTANMFARKTLDGEQSPQGSPGVSWDLSPPDASTLVDDSYAFEVGGRRFEVLAVPGGESLDGLAVWVAEERTVWIGNLMGALFGALPHLSTIRGDRPRSAMLFIESVQRVLDLAPALLLTGHEEPIRGEDRIQAEVGKVIAAVRYIHDQTIEGMNAGSDLATLMATITLPRELQTAKGRGPVSWYVRAVWEEYIGWFRSESLTELYAVPQLTIWPELAELAGGVDALAERARRRVEAGQPLEALHFTDLILGIDPQHRSAHEVRLVALERLLERSGAEAYDEARLLELEIARERAALA